MKHIMAAVLVLAAAASPAHGQGSRTVLGRVASGPDDTPLPGARVIVRGTAIEGVTDQRGTVQLVGVPRRPFMIVFERLGFNADSVKVTADQTLVTMTLQPVPVQLAPVIAEAPAAARQRFEEVAQTSTINLAPAEITSAPGLAEADVTRAIQLLPGTVSKNDFSTTLNIRGGEGDQNLFQLDGITLFNPTHMGGLFSTFDASAVETVELITGGFPATYGGRLSSVVDVQLREGNPSRFSARGQLSLLSAKLLVEGPVGRTGVRYLVGGRRTYADAIVNTFSPGTLPYYFADGLAKVTAPTPGNGSVSFTGYWGRDVLDFDWEDDASARTSVNVLFDWGNRAAGFSLEQPIGPFVLQHHLGVSKFTTSLAVESDLAGVKNTARLRSAAASVSLPRILGHDIRIGGAIEAYRMEYDIGSEAIGAEFFNDAYHPTVRSLFVDDQWRPFEWLILRPGVRFQSVAEADFESAAPRVSVKLFAGDNHAFVGSIGRYHQAIHSLRDQEIPYAIFEFWVGAGEFIPVGRSDHVVLGFERWVLPDLSVTVEGYRKTFANLVTRNREQDLKRRDDDFIPTEGDAWGGDVLIRKYSGKVTGWVAYSFTNASRTADGETFPPAHDRRHTVNIVAQTDGPWGSELGVRWGYGSPLPFNGFRGQWRHRVYDEVTHSFDNFNDEPIASEERNAERYPAYNRLDISLRWETVKWGGLLKPYVQLVNAYNRKNVFVYTFDYDRPPPIRKGISQIPLVPTFGVEFQW